MKTLNLFLSVCFLLSTTVVSFAQYEIGHTTITFNDPDREGGFGDSGLPGRDIQTEIYYPADVAGTDVDLASGEYPVIVFGHGFSMVWSAYENLWEEFVARGYIMAFPRTEGGFSPSHENFGMDLALVAEEMLAEGQDANSLFFNHVSPNVAIAGHSMGGGATKLAAANNTTIKTIVGLASAETDPSAVAAAADITVPALFLSGDGDAVTPPDEHHIPIYEALNSECKYFVNILGGAHCYYANSNFNCDFGESTTGGNITITRAEQHQITFDYLNAWFDYQLKGMCSAFDDFRDLVDTDNRTEVEDDCNYVAPEITADGDINLCDGESVTLTSNQTDNLEWSTGDTDASITVSTSGTYSVFNNETCLESNEITVTVGETPDTPQITVNGDIEICDNESTELTVDPQGDNVVWSTGETTNSIVVDQSGSYTVYLETDNGCQSETSTAVEVVVTPSPDASWNSPGAICLSEGTIDLDGLVTGDAGGSWSGTGVTGSTFNPDGLSGQTVEITYVVSSDGCDDELTQTIQVEEAVSAAWTAPDPICDNETINLDDLVTGNGGGTWSGNGVSGSTFEYDAMGVNQTVEVTYSVGIGDCSDSEMHEIEVFATPQAPEITVNGETDLCEGETVELTVNTDGHDAVWSNEETGNSIIVDESGVYMVQLITDSGCESEASASVEILVHPAPFATWTSPGALCESDAPINLDDLITGDAGGEWSGTGVTGNTFDPAGLEGQSVEVTYSIELGNCSDSETHIIEVDEAISAAWTAPEFICENESVNLSDYVTGNNGGTWSGQGVTGTTFDPAGLSGIVDITYAIGSGDCADEETHSVEVTEVLIPEISQNGTLLECSVTADSYQWYLNGDPIAGATDQTYEATETGDYAVSVTYESGCEEISDDFYLDFTSVDGHEFEDQINMYPNPAQHHVQIELDERKLASLAVFGMDGKLLTTVPVQSSMITLDVSGFAQGIYIVRFEDEAGVPVHTEKLVVQ